jgi:hypothetical protein
MHLLRRAAFMETPRASCVWRRVRARHEALPVSPMGNRRLWYARFPIVAAERARGCTTLLTRRGCRCRWPCYRGVKPGRRLQWGCAAQHWSRTRRGGGLKASQACSHSLESLCTFTRVALEDLCAAQPLRANNHQRSLRKPAGAGPRNWQTPGTNGSESLHVPGCRIPGLRHAHGSWQHIQFISVRTGHVPVTPDSAHSQTTLGIMFLVRRT